MDRMSESSTEWAKIVVCPGPNERKWGPNERKHGPNERILDRMSDSYRGIEWPEWAKIKTDFILNDICKEYEHIFLFGQTEWAKIGRGG